MEFKRLFMVLAVCFAFTTTGYVFAKPKVIPRIYMYGFSTSFTDSIVHFTDIVPVDNAWIESSNDFLLGRENYSYQLRDFINNKLNIPNRTCIVVYDKSKKKLEKAFLKMRKLYTIKNKGKYDVRYLNSNEFTFKAVNMNNED